MDRNGVRAAWAIRADLGLAACQAIGVYLLTVFAVSLAVHAVLRPGVWTGPAGWYPFGTPRAYAGSAALWLGCGIAGVALLGGGHLARLVRPRRRLGRSEVPGEFYPLVTTVFCVALTLLLAR